MAGALATDLLEAETLGGVLARRRLKHRAGRVRLVLLALHERAESSARSGAVPVGLRHAIRDFSAELAQIERRLNASRARPDRSRERERLIPAGYGETYTGREAECAPSS